MNANATQMNANRPEPDAISSRIIGCGFTVANTLGGGFLEKVYETVLAAELRMAGLVNRSVVSRSQTKASYL